MRIYIDYDSTLVDLVGAWTKWIKKYHRYNISKHDILHWNWISNSYGEEMNEYWKTPGIYEEISPIPGARAFIQALNSLYGEENVFILSASYCKMEEEKERHAQRWFDIPHYRFLHKHDKHRWTSDGVLIDDAPHHIIDHVTHNNLPGFLFNYHNGNGWSKTDFKHNCLTKCIYYGQLLEAIASNETQKYFLT